MKTGSQRKVSNFQKQIEVGALQLAILFLGSISLYLSIRSGFLFSTSTWFTLVILLTSFFSTFLTGSSTKNRKIQYGIWFVLFGAVVFFAHENLKIYGALEFWNQPELFINMALFFIYGFSVFNVPLSVASWLFSWGVISWFIHLESTSLVSDTTRGPASVGLTMGFWELIPLDKIGLHTLGLGGLFSLLTFIKNKMNDFMATLLTGRSQKMMNLGALSASLGHELSNPLTSLKGFTEILKTSDEILKNPELNGIIQRIEFNVNRMADITRALKGFSQSETKKSKVTSKELIDDILILLEHHLKTKKIELKINSDTKSKELYWICDRVEVGQILFNLVSNARDALNESAVKIIQIDIHPARNGGFSIDVFDSGPGISDDHKEKIFDPEFTTKNFGEGSGLGLWLSKTLAEKNGLNLQLIESKSPLGGANFRLSSGSS